MNNWNELRPIDILVWLSTVFAQQNVMIGKVLIELNEENLKVNTKNSENNSETLNYLKNIEKSLLTLIEKLDEKNG